MTLLSAALVAATVLIIGAVHSIRWRALVYSMPIPITLVLLTTTTHVDGSQLLGVLLLNAFVTVVALLHGQARWHILLADTAGVAVYLGLGWPIAQLSPISFLPVLVAICSLWLLAVALLRPDRHTTTTSTTTSSPLPSPLERFAKVTTVVTSALLVVAVGGWINGLAVTFPYSGVLVVIETRRHLDQFARHFARNSIALVAFFTAYWTLQGHNRLLAIGAAWLAFALTATTLNLVRMGNRRLKHPPDPDDDRPPAQLHEHSPQRSNTELPG